MWLIALLLLSAPAQFSLCMAEQDSTTAGRSSVFGQTPRRAAPMGHEDDAERMEILEQDEQSTREQLGTLVAEQRKHAPKSRNDSIGHQFRGGEFSPRPGEIDTEEVIDRIKPEVYEHEGGGLISDVMKDIIDKLPYIPRPPGTVINGTALMRQIRLRGDYQADVPLVLSSYMTVFLDGTLTPTLKLAGGNNMPQGNLMAALILSSKADMVGVEGAGNGAVLDCSGWTSTNETTNTSSLVGIWFDSVLGAWVRNATVRNCGMGAPAGPRPGYGSGNIRTTDCFGAAIAAVTSYGSYNRGLWSQASRIVVWNSLFHDNIADGIDFDSATGKSVAFNNVCNDNGRHGIFVKEGASYNTLVQNTCLRNKGSGIVLGSLYGPSGTNENTVLANTLGPDDYPGSGGPGSSISFGGSDYPHRQLDLLAVGNTINGNVASHGYLAHSLFALNENVQSYQDFNVVRQNDSLWLNNP